MTNHYSPITPLERASTPEMRKLLVEYGANKISSPSPQDQDYFLRKTRGKVKKDAEKAVQEFHPIEHSLKEEIGQFIHIPPLVNIIVRYCAPLTLKKTISSNKKAANRRVQEIQDRLARQQAASSNSSAPTIAHSADVDNVRRNPLDTDEEKHDARGNIVPPPTQDIESLD